MTAVILARKSPVFPETHVNEKLKAVDTACPLLRGFLSFIFVLKNREMKAFLLAGDVPCQWPFIFFISFEFFFDFFQI